MRRIVIAAAALAALAALLGILRTEPAAAVEPDSTGGITVVGEGTAAAASASAILTLGVGGLYVFPRTRTVERTIGRLVAESRPPTPDEQQVLARASGQARAAGWVVLVGLVLAVTCMATASYWSVFL